MGILNLPSALRTLERVTVRNSPLLLTAIGVVGTVTTALLTARATVQAVRIVDSETDAWLYDKEYHRLNKKWVIKETWKLYIPPLSVAAVTVTSIILANRIGTRRAAALAAAYSLSEKAFDEYREKIVEKMGPKKEREARDEIAQERVTRNPGSASVIVPEGLDVLCYDEYSNRWFTGNMERIKKAENDLNWQLIHHDAASLNELYSKLGLDPIHYGELIGWNAFRKLELSCTSVLRGDGKPAISIHFSYDPEPNYDSNH